ncbi:hypothetical protein ACLOJK_021044 [Asimina triloba]
MVAISLYRGNLHLRNPDRPRQWPMPHRCISLRDFKRLTHRRSKALSLLPLPSSSSSFPIVPPKQQLQQQDDDPLPPLPPSQLLSNHRHDSQSRPDAAEPLANAAEATEEAAAAGALKPALPNGSNGPEDCNREGGNGGGLKDSQEAAAAGNGKAVMEVTIGSDAPDDKLKRKKELERKLQSLNERKHQLVQALKQILNAEEEMMRRNSIQMAGLRSGVPLQVEANAVPKTSGEGNLGDDLEGESEDASNHNTQARHMQTQCTSPSMASPLRRPGYGSLQHNTAAYPSRGGLILTGLTQTTSSMLTGVIASPSRFAPPGHQGPAVSLPPVSISGSHFIASSPSPAASGGTSGFRDDPDPSQNCWGTPIDNARPQAAFFGLLVVFSSFPLLGNSLVTDHHRLVKMQDPFKL